MIDTAANTVEFGIPVPRGAGAVAITPDGKHVYVTSSFGGTVVSVIDTATNTVVGTPIPVGTNPFAVAVTPDGKHAYVTNLSSSNVSVIDTAINTVATTVTVGSTPVGVGIIPPPTSALQVSPATNIAASGVQGQIFSPASFAYQLSSTSGSVHYLISGISELAQRLLHYGHCPAHSYRHLLCERLRVWGVPQITLNCAKMLTDFNSGADRSKSTRPPFGSD